MIEQRMARIQFGFVLPPGPRADWWNVSWTGLADYCDQVAELERASAEVGRDPATLRRI
jgi:hypothetical protein